MVGFSREMSGGKGCVQESRHEIRRGASVPAQAYLRPVWPDQCAVSEHGALARSSQLAPHVR